MTEVIIPVKVYLDNQFFEDIICAMLEGGSNHWIDGVKFDPPKPRGIPSSIYAANLINDGKTITIVDSDEPQNHTIGKDAIIKGIKKWVEKHPNHVSFDVEAGRQVIDAGNIDADEADRILQYAVFGELVYG